MDTNPEAALSEAVRDAIKQSPLKSVRAAAEASGIPYTSLDRYIKRGGWKTADLRRLSALTDVDLLEAAR